MLVGAPEKPLAVAALPPIFRRRSFSGSLIGGLPRRRRCWISAAPTNITSGIGRIGLGQINETYERMLRNDVKYRFVIDMASLA